MPVHGSPVLLLRALHWHVPQAQRWEELESAWAVSFIHWNHPSRCHDDYWHCCILNSRPYYVQKQCPPPPQVLRMSSNNFSTAKGLSPIRVQGLRVSNASSPQGQGMTCNNAPPLTEKPGIFQVQIPCPPNIHANVQDANRALIQSGSWITVPPLNHPVGSMQPSQTNPPSVRSFINFCICICIIC
jgi:hypothetical protein